MFPAQHFSHAQACRSALHHRAAAAAAAVRQPSAAAAVAVPTHHRVCSFSFANSQRANKPTGRRNKHVVKREEGQLRNIAAGLCNFNGKQLQAVSHLLSAEHIKQVKIGMDIPPTNQGRKRQVGLVMKLLRADLDDSTLLKLTEAVQQSARYNLPYSDRDVEQQVDVWLEGLLGNDQEVVSEVYELLQSRQQDCQQMRTWVRQLQQHEQEQQQQQQQQQQEAEAAADSTRQPVEQSATSSAVAQVDVVAVAARDPEVAQLIQEFNQQQQQQESGKAGSSSGKSKGGKSPAAAARRSIRRMLKPLALDAL